ncbi:MAG: hypothetical protein ACRDDZ_07415 [Marinifilaceae bacterium]
MAIIETPIEKISGKIQNVVYYNREGVQIARSKPAVKYYKQTDAQLRARCRFVLLSQLGRMFNAALVKGFCVREKGQSFRTQFVKTNGKCLDSNVINPSLIPWHNLSLSQGNMTPPLISAIANRATNSLTLSIVEQQPTAFTQPDDKVMFYVIQPQRYQTQVAPKTDAESWLSYYNRIKNNPLFTFTENGWIGANRFDVQSCNITYNAAIEGPLLIYYFAYNERTGDCSATQWMEV